MAELIDRLPGGIKGLLRNGSPLFWRRFNGHGAWEPAIQAGHFRRALNDGRVLEFGETAVDLTDPTGRVHAAWYAAERQPMAWSWSAREIRAVRCACDGLPMTPEQIDTLARLVLRLAADDLYDMMAAMRST